MIRSRKINIYSKNGSVLTRMIKVMIILVFFGSLLYHPEAILATEDNFEEVQNTSYYSYVPITLKRGIPYYVSTFGNDTNPGTFQSPWRTISKAINMVGPGGTVYVRDGIYQEKVKIYPSGTSNAPIRILAFPGENPIIDGNNFQIPGSDWGVLLSISGDYVQVSGFEVRYSSGIGVLISGSYDIASNIYSHHSKQNGILITSGHNSIIENSRVWRNSFSNEYGQQGNWSSGISAARNGVNNAIIRRNIVWENWGEGISAFGTNNITIEDNIIHDNYTSNIYISDAIKILCQRNFVYTDPLSYVFPYGFNVGIAMGDERYDPPSADITIINNISTGNSHNFYWWQGTQGGGMNNVLIANNTFVNSIGTSGVTIQQGSHQNVRFMNNLVLQVGPLPGIIVETNPELYFSNNLWSKTPVSIALGAGDIIGDPLFAQIGNPYMPNWYTLTGVSPAIDRAMSISEVNVDYFGINREAPPDVGANEFFPVP